MLADLQGNRASYESGLERDFFIRTAFLPRLSFFEWNPITIEYTDSRGAPRIYTPDARVQYDQGVGDETVEVVELVEIKYEDELQKKAEEFKDRFAAAEYFASTQGWVFKVLTEREIRTPFLENARFLWRYHSISLDDPTPNHPKRLMDAIYERGCVSVDYLLAACYPSMPLRAEALTYVWALIAQHRIGADLDVELTMRSQIWTLS